jgi:hypothetical protein
LKIKKSDWLLVFNKLFIIYFRGPVKIIRGQSIQTIHWSYWPASLNSFHEDCQLVLLFGLPLTILFNRRSVNPVHGNTKKHQIVTGSNKLNVLKTQKYLLKEGISGC